MSNRSIVPINRKRALKGSLFGLVLAGILSLQALGAEGRGVSETGAREESPVTLDVVYGYQNIAKSGRFLPLRIEIQNQRDQAFKGTLCVLAMESELKGYSMEQEYDMYRYEYPFKVEASGSLVKALSISLGARMDQMYVRILDESGKEVTQKRLKLNLNLETAELFIGVLSDNPAKLLYLNGVGINYSTLRTRTIEMNADSLPDSELGLDQLDVLLVTDFDTGRLSKQQIEAVWEWVQEGGTLLIGTGERGEDVLRGFGSQLLEAPLPQPDRYVVNMGVEYAVDEPEGASIPLICTEVPLNGATEVLSSDELSVVSSVSVGQGTVAVSIYDFGDIENFCQDNISYIDNLFFSLLGEEKVNLLASSKGGSTSEQYWSVQSLINTGDLNRLPKVGLYVTLAASYVVLAGPGLYFFLKQRGLRQYYQLSVAALSVCCTGMVIIMGMSTRFTGPFFTYAAIRDADREEITETTFINMRTPNNKPFSVELDSSYMLYPITGNPAYDMIPVPKFTGEENPAVTIRYEEESTRIKADGVGAFNSKFFQLERNKKNEEGVGFTGSINFFDGQVSGSVTNHYNQEVENVAVLLYNQMILIDHMGPGETVKLDGREVIYGAFNFSYAMAEQITGVSKYKRDGDIEDAGYVEALERTNLLSFYMSNYLSGYHSEARIVAFSKEKDETDFLKKGDYETYGSTLLTSSVDVNYEKDGMVYRFAMQKKPNVLSGEYYAPNNTMYGLTPVILEYYLGNDLEIKKLNFCQLSGQMEDSMRYYYVVPFDGKIYFYNYNSGSYDSMMKGALEYTKEQLEPYLSPGNTLTIKYVYDTAGEYNWNIMLPTLTVTGRSK